MGSEKFPDENSFDTFIKQHGGSDNASTDTERVSHVIQIMNVYECNGKNIFMRWKMKSWKDGTLFDSKYFCTVFQYLNKRPT